MVVLIHPTIIYMYIQFRPTLIVSVVSIIDAEIRNLRPTYIGGPIVGNSSNLILSHNVPLRTRKRRIRDLLIHSFLYGRMLGETGMISSVLVLVRR